jgi:hypothetical protein
MSSSVSRSQESGIAKSTVDSGFLRQQCHISRGRCGVSYGRCGCECGGCASLKEMIYLQWETTTSPERDAASPAGYAVSPEGDLLGICDTALLGTGNPCFRQSGIRGGFPIPRKPKTGRLSRSQELVVTCYKMKGTLYPDNSVSDNAQKRFLRRVSNSLEKGTPPPLSIKGKKCPEKVKRVRTMR